MKKPAVPTTTASGAAVSSSRITAVQSVYMGLRVGTRPSSQPDHRRGAGGFTLPPPGLPLVALLLAGLLLPLPPLRAGVLFENCSTAADGSITCDTVPTGDTLMDAEAARDGLLQNASPGWSEFEPYEGFDDEFGGNGT